MAYTGKKPSFEQIRVDELIVRQGTSVSVAAGSATVALNVDGVSFIRVEISGTSSAETTIEGIVAPSATEPARNGKVLVLKNDSDTDFLVFKQESGTAAATNRLITGISAELRVSPKGLVTLTYDNNAERWNVSSTSSEALSSLIVGTDAIALSNANLDLTAQEKKSSLIELTNGGVNSLCSVTVGYDGELLILINKTGGILQVTNEDLLVLDEEKRILTGTGAPVTIQENASIMLAYKVAPVLANSRWHIVGGTGSGGGATEQVSQTGIGIALDFPIGTPLYVDATGWHKASALGTNTAEVSGLISRHLNNDLAEVSLSGEVAEVTADAFVEASLPSRGDVVFLSTTEGKLSVSDVTTVGYVSKPVGIVHNVNGTSSVDVMFYNQRGVVVGSANARTQLALAGSSTVPTTTPIQDVSEYEAGELSGWVYINSDTDYQFYFQTQFAKNGDGTDYNIAVPQTVGDTPPVGFDIDISTSGLIQLTLPALTGFVNSYINYAINAPAVGASLPLSINSSNVYTNYKTVSGAYTIVPSDDLIVATGLVAYAITLPTAVGMIGKKHTIKSELDPSVALTVDTTGGEFIDGVTSRLLENGESLTVVSDGSKWVDVSIPVADSLRFKEIRARNNSGIFVKNAANTATNMFISSAGNVGIGTTVPLAKLTVGNAQTYPDTNTIAQFSGSTEFCFNNAQLYRAQAEVDSGAFYLGSNTYYSGGWQVFDNTKAPSQIQMIASNNNSYISFFTSTTNSGNGIERMRIDASGSFLVGTTSSSDNTNGVKISPPSLTQTLKIMKTNTGIQNGILFYQSGVYQGGLNYGSGNTFLATSSDIRLKQNVQNSAPVLEKINQINIRSFQWKDYGTTTEYGFVAQELQTVFPEAVHVGVDNGATIEMPWSVSPVTLIPHLIKAVQELSTKVDAQQAKIDQLEADVAQLEADVAALQTP